MSMQQQRILITVMVLCLIGVMGLFVGGYDYQPPLWALQIELSGGSAYGAEMAQRFQDDYAEPFGSGGFGYPLPVMWLALPIIALPEGMISVVWCMLNVGSVLLGLILLRMPRYMVFFLPLPLGMYLQQVTVLLTGLLLIGIWAWRTRRWWLLGAMLALTMGAKPQATLVIAGGLAVLGLRAGAWKQIFLCGFIVGGLTFALEPTWIPQWLEAVARYCTYVRLPSALPWLPIAVVLLLLRQFWGALAVLQICLFPTLFGYSLLPLLIGYVEPHMHRFALWAVVSSWVMVLLVGIRPVWLTAGICYLVPLLVAAIKKARNKKDGELCWFPPSLS